MTSIPISITYRNNTIHTYLEALYSSRFEILLSEIQIQFVIGWIEHITNYEPSLDVNSYKGTAVIGNALRLYEVFPLEYSSKVVLKDTYKGVFSFRL